MRSVWAVAVAASCWLPAPAGAQSRGDADLSPHSDVTLVTAVDRTAPGARVTVGVRITLDAGWHTYWVNGGDAGLPLSVTWTLPAGVTASAPRFPTPRLLPQRPLMSYGYERELVALVDLTIDAGVSRATPLSVTADADWLACADVCLPAKGRASLSLPLDESAVPRATEHAVRLATAERQVPPDASPLDATVWAGDSTLWLRVIDASADDPRLASPYFFPDSAGIIDHARAQRVTRAGDTLWMALPRSRFGSVPERQFSGVLSADPTRHDGVAWHVVAEVQPDAEAALPTRGQLLLTATTVTKSGGLEIAEAAHTADTSDAGAGDAAPMGLWAALLFALLGGVLLNLMPCVFPVLSLKVLSFVQRGAGDPSIARKHAAVFAGGVFAAFWALALVLLAVRAGGASVGWGFQLQSPAVVALLAMLMFGVGLNLAGVFEVGMGLTRLGAVGQGTGYRDSFLTGALAVVVATPCTAPFMGAALGYALVQPAVVGLAVFSSLAAGLALPYVLLAWSPALMRRLPRPGPWLETFKQMLAFPMFATVVWLLWVFGQQAGNDALALVMLTLTLLAFGAWLWGRAQRRSARTAALGIMTVAVLGAGLVGRSGAVGTAPAAAATQAVAGDPAVGAGAVTWQDYTPAALEAARASGRPVLLDFTAAWCLSCQVNERVALSAESVHRAVVAGNVILMRADWTSRDADIAQVISSFGRSGIPLYVLYAADPAVPPELLPSVLTPQIVVNALARAAAIPPATD